MTKRKALGRKLEKEIYQQFGSKCPFCGEQDVTTLQAHHIVAHAEVQEHHAKNLLLTCANCHQKIEGGVIPAREVYSAKFQAEQGKANAVQSTSKSQGNVLSFRGSNAGIVANTVNISSKSSAAKHGPVPRTIGAEFELRNYAKYLIDRYHDFKKAEVDKGMMNYALIYVAIKRKFGAKWDHLQTDAFDALVVNLKKRIDGTRLGKTRRAKNSKNYSSFDDHRAKSNTYL